MTTFEIISIVIGLLIPTSLVIGVSVRTQIALAKIQVEIANFKKDLIQKEIALNRLEDQNREDHKDIKILIKELKIV